MGDALGTATKVAETGATGSQYLNYAILASLLIYPLAFRLSRGLLNKETDHYKMTQALFTGPNIPLAFCMIFGLALPELRLLVTAQPVYLAICGGIVILSVYEALRAP